MPSLPSIPLGRVKGHDLKRLGVFTTQVSIHVLVVIIIT